MKRFISALLCASMLASSVLFSACANNETPTDKQDQESTPAVENTESDTESAVEETRYEANVPESNMEERTFSFLSSNWVQEGLRHHEIYAEDYTGDTINDAVYDRQLIISDRFKCNITLKSCYDWQVTQRTLGQSVQANDGAYDFVLMDLNRYQNSVSAGYYAELDKIPYLDFTQIWYDQNSYEQLSLANRHFVVCSDITIVDKDNTSMICFNKAIVEELQLENLYDLVKSGKWTLDKMNEMMSGVYEDVNGDGVMDEEDFYGMMGIRDALISLLTGGGLYIATKDENDIPVLSIGTEEVLNALDKISAMLYDDNLFFDTLARNSAMGPEGLFRDGHSLFCWTKGNIESLREMEVDFGVLPLPKHTEEQENYHCDVNAWTAICFGVVTTALKDDQKADDDLGIFIESFACEGRNLIRTAYYDTILQGKVARDEESKDMLDIIFNNRVYDVGAIGNWMDVAYMLAMMPMTKNTGFATVAASMEKTVNRTIGKMIDKINENYQ